MVIVNAAIASSCIVLYRSMRHRIVHHKLLNKRIAVFNIELCTFGYAGRSANSQIIQLMLKFITEYEKEHGRIDLTEENK